MSVITMKSAKKTFKNTVYLTGPVGTGTFEKRAPGVQRRLYSWYHKVVFTEERHVLLGLLNYLGVAGTVAECLSRRVGIISYPDLTLQFWKCENV